jgi:hypothetical protein
MDLLYSIVLGYLVKFHPHESGNLNGMCNTLPVGNMVRAVPMQLIVFMSERTETLSKFDF